MGEVIAIEITDFGCTIMMNWTIEDAKSYVRELKKIGFNQMTEEQDLANMDIYIFIASNGEYSVTISLVDG